MRHTHHLGIAESYALCVSYEDVDYWTMVLPII